MISELNHQGVQVPDCSHTGQRPGGLVGFDFPFHGQFPVSMKIHQPGIYQSEIPDLVQIKITNISLAQPCPPFTCIHPSQPPTLAHTLSTKSSNLSTLALFWTLNSPCTSLLYDVLPRDHTTCCPGTSTCLSCFLLAPI